MINKKPKFRTLANVSKGLEEKRIDLITEMEKIISSAEGEKRNLTTEESKQFNRIKSDIEKVVLELEEINCVRNMEIYTQNNAENRMLNGIVFPNEKLEKRTYKENNIDFAKLVRGMSGQGWNDAKNEREYYRTMESGTSKVVIPEQLADRIIDYARNKSAIFGNIPVVPMDNNNLTIAVQTKDGQATFVKENELIPASDITFSGVKLEGKTLALFIPISEQLLESASNLSAQLVASCANAIGQALDKALIYGNGVIDNTSYEIKGVANYESINKISHTNIDYDLVIKGAKEIKKANLVPTNVCFNTDLATELQMLKTTDGQYISTPKAIEEYTLSESNNMKPNETIVYDNQSLLLGIQKNITIEWGSSGDMFQRIQKGLRIHIRADLGVINPKGVTLVTVAAN